MDISAFRDRQAASSMTVSELNNYIKNVFDSNRLLSSVTVKGEISNFVHHRSGHMYFSLKDSEGQIRAVMFRSNAMSLKFAPENGMKVILHGSVTVYPRDGSYQLYASTMQPDGVGALYLAYEQLKQRLEAEGLFHSQYKKTIPKYPERIGVITSPTGAAVRDIINVISRRYPLATVYLYPSLVQGDGAEENLIKAVDYFDKSKLVDTVIIGRGGGSIEDLWAFNSEALARRIFAAEVPIISAVGHETDFTICDFVSDLRAPTPSAAAELSVPDLRELLMRIDSYFARCDNSLKMSLKLKKERFTELLRSYTIAEPIGLVEGYREALREVIEELNRAYDTQTSLLRSRFSATVGKLEALNPLSVLGRGYSVTECDGKAITSSSEISKGQTISVRLCDGRLEATVTDVQSGWQNGEA